MKQQQFLFWVKEHAPQCFYDEVYYNGKLVCEVYEIGGWSTYQIFGEQWKEINKEISSFTTKREVKDYFNKNMGRINKIAGIWK